MSHIQIRIDPAQKAAATQTLKKMGLSVSAGIKLFLRNVVEEQKLPFEISAQSKTDTVAMQAEALAQEPPPKPLKDIPVQTWNPFNKHKIG